MVIYMDKNMMESSNPTSKKNHNPHQNIIHLCDPGWFWFILLQLHHIYGNYLNEHENDIKNFITYDIKEKTLK